LQIFRQIIRNKIEKLGIILNNPGSLRARLKGIPIDLYSMMFRLSKMGINPKTILDIGAFEGMFTKSAHHVFPGATIHAFEPIRKSYIKLSRLKSSILNFNCYNIALGDKENEEPINVSSFAPSSSLLKMDKTHKEACPYSAGESEEQIVIKRLDEVFKNKDFNRPVLMKIDVQGYENFVLAGGSETLKQTDYLVCELSFRQLYKDQALFDDVYGQIVNAGFRFMGQLAELQHPKTTEVLQIDGLFKK
jgi:FkbM family methyltransferase